MSENNPTIPELTNNPTITEPLTLPEIPNNPTLGQEAQYLLTRYQYIKKKYYNLKWR